MSDAKKPDRRQQIVDAAAELLCSGTGGRLTHRQIAAHAGVPLGSTTYYFTDLDDLIAAALAELAAQIDDELSRTAERVAAAGDPVSVLAQTFNDYLTDLDQVRTETAIYVAGLQRPELRELSLRWFTGLVDLLKRHTDPATATAMAVFVDGATLYTALHDQPLPPELIEHTTTLLLAAAGSAPSGVAE